MKISFLSFLFLLIYSCGDDNADSPGNSKTESNSEINHDKSSINNYIILLDLSDRLIKPTYDGLMQFQRDTALLQGILTAFKSISNENLFNCEDQLTIKIAFQEKPLYSEAQFASDLNIDFKKFNGYGRDDKSKYMSDKLNSCNKAIIDLYQQAASSSETNDYQGADIWRYLKENLEFDIKRDEKEVNYSNLLMIITDGYMDFENSRDKRSVKNKSNTGDFIYEVAKKKEVWEDYFDKNEFGFVPINNTCLKNTKVIIAEIAPKADYHREILEKTWRNLLYQMGADSNNVFVLTNMISCDNVLDVFRKAIGPSI